jgi:peptidoglycan/xylan/chitin deacetylase (PgdA/CDA1 family)
MRLMRCVRDLLLMAALTMMTTMATLASGTPVVPGVPVLIYHQIVAGEHPGNETVISLRRFTEQMDHLAAEGYRTLSMDELIAVMEKRQPLPQKAVVLTFDDGWKNVLNAVPALDRHGFKASFWIITDKGIGHPNLTWPDIEALARNPRFEIQSHTASHPWHRRDNLVTWMEGKVPGRGPADVRAELVDSKRTLEKRLGRAVDYVAWPVGWFNEAMVRLAREAGYKAVLTAEDGWNSPGDDVFRIKRVFVDGACTAADFRRILVDSVYRPCQAGGTVTRGHSPHGR